MRLRLIPLCLAALLLLTVPKVYAATIVDTGPGPDSSGGFSLYQDQWLAGEFTITEFVTIASVEGWMNVYTPGSLDIAIYTDGGDIPGLELFRASGNLGAETPATWRGLSGLTWNLLPGTYWVAFEVTGSSSFSGSMPGPSQFPLDNEAFYCGGPGCVPPNVYNPADYLDLGVRIEGAVTAVPDPTSSLSLLALGVASLGLFSSRRRNY
jgi:hypothetical protein